MIWFAAAAGLFMLVAIFGVLVARFVNARYDAPQPEFRYDAPPRGHEFIANGESLFWDPQAPPWANEFANDYLRGDIERSAQGAQNMVGMAGYLNGEGLAANDRHATMPRERHLPGGCHGLGIYRRY